MMFSYNQLPHQHQHYHQHQRYNSTHTWSLNPAALVVLQANPGMGHHKVYSNKRKCKLFELSPVLLLLVLGVWEGA